MDREKIKLPVGLQLVNGKLMTNLRCEFAPVVRERKKIDLALNPESFEELLPSAEDYLRLQFRALSAAYLGASGYFLDFSRPGVLRASIPLMLPKEKSGSRRRYLMFHRNHSSAIQDRIGFIENAEWGKASGEQSAPGINIDVMMDWKLAPNEARQLLSDPPLVDSVSVSVSFDWEKSHPDMRDYQFWDFLGHEMDGQVVRIIVTEITEYYHVGLVWEGADEEADKLQRAEGKAQGADKIQKPNSKGQHSDAGGMMKNPLTLSEKRAKKIFELLGLSEEPNEEDLLEGVRALAEANEELQVKNVALEEKAKEYQRVMELRRKEVIALIAKVDGECKKSFETALGLMKWEDLQEIAADYQSKLDAKFPLACGNCGSKNVSARSSREEDVHEPNTNGKADKIDPARFRVV